MAHVIQLRCRHCGEPLQNRETSYCPPCNLYLAYRAMPLLLGLLLTGSLLNPRAWQRSYAAEPADPDLRGYDDDAVLIRE